MIVVTGGRRSGKTSAVIRWLLERPGQRGVIVVDRSRARFFMDAIREAAPHLDPEHFRGMIVTAEKFYGPVSRGTHWPFTEVAIDDAEDVLRVMLGSIVGFMAMTATWIPLAPATPEPIKAQVVNNELPFDTEPGTHGYVRPKGGRVPDNFRMEINSKDVG